MSSILPADTGARRLALIVWTVGAVAGTIAVWWLSIYIEELTRLADTDPEASIALFRTRVIPALAVVVLVAVGAGVLLFRQGLIIVRTARFPPEGARLVRDTPVRTGETARALGMLLAAAGFLLAAIPILMLGVIWWVLG